MCVCDYNYARNKTMESECKNNREVEYGSLGENLELLKRISPINHIDNIKSPLFIIQGDTDERVPLQESIQMYEKLKKKGLDCELLRFADEGHGITKLRNKLIAYPRVVTWLQGIIKKTSDADNSIW